MARCGCPGLTSGQACPTHPGPGDVGWDEELGPRTTLVPESGTRLSDPIRPMVLRANDWRPGTYLLYQRGIEYYRPGEEPAWLAGEVYLCGHHVGPLPCYRDQATNELVPVLAVEAYLW